MAIFRPTSKFKPYKYQQRIVFSGTHNDLHRQDSYLLVRAKQMVSLLTINAGTFPTPPTALADMQSAIDDHSASVIAVGFKGNRGSHAAFLQRDITRAALLNACLGNGLYVQAIARSLSPTSDIYVQTLTLLQGGTATKMRGRLNLPSIFGLGEGSRNYISARVDRAPAPPRAIKIVLPRQPQTPGQTRLRWGKLKGAVSYIVYSCNNITGAVVGAVHTTTAAAYTSSLTSGQRDCIRVQAVGPFNTKSGLSQPFFYTAT